MLILDLDFSASETPSEEGCSHAWELDDRSSSHWPDDSSTSAASSSCTRAVPLNLANHPTHVVLDRGCKRSIGSRAATKRFQKHAWYYGIKTEFCLHKKSCVLPILRRKLVLKVVLFTFRQHLHVLPELTHLRRTTCLSYSPSLR